MVRNSQKTPMPIFGALVSWFTMSPATAMTKIAPPMVQNHFQFIRPVSAAAPQPKESGTGEEQDTVPHKIIDPTGLDHRGGKTRWKDQ